MEVWKVRFQIFRYKRIRLGVVEWVCDEMNMGGGFHAFLNSYCIPRWCVEHARSSVPEEQFCIFRPRYWVDSSRNCVRPVCSSVGPCRCVPEASKFLLLDFFYLTQLHGLYAIGWLPGVSFEVREI